MTTAPTTGPSEPPLYFRPIAWVAAGLASLLIIFVIMFFSSLSGNQNDMTKKEAKLSAVYSDNQNVLSTFRNSIKEALGVARESTEAQNKVLTNAIEGRYKEGSSAAPGSGTAFSAIVEAYPDIKMVGQTFQNVQDAIFAGRKAFQNAQTRLLDLVRDYDQFTNRAGFMYLHKLMINMIGAPSDHLQARIGSDVKKGQKALDRMRQILISDDTKDSFENGTDNGLDLEPPTTP